MKVYILLKVDMDYLEICEEKTIIGVFHTLTALRKKVKELGLEKPNYEYVREIVND